MRTLNSDDSLELREAAVRRSALALLCRLAVLMVSVSAGAGLLLWLGPREQVLADPLEWSSRVWVATLWLVCTAYYLITVDECASREAASPLSVLTMNLASGGAGLRRPVAQ